MYFCCLDSNPCGNATKNTASGNRKEEERRANLSQVNPLPFVLAPLSRSFLPVASHSDKLLSFGPAARSLAPSHHFSSIGSEGPKLHSSHRNEKQDRKCPRSLRRARSPSTTPCRFVGQCAVHMPPVAVLWVKRKTCPIIPATTPSSFPWRTARLHRHKLPRDTTPLKLFSAG